MLRRRWRAVQAALVVLAITGIAAAEPTPTTVKVTLTDTSVKLSRTTVPSGTVRFRVVNNGKRSHFFKVDGKRTAALSPGKTATLLVKLTASGRITYFESSPRKSGILKVESKVKTQTSSGSTAEIAAGEKLFKSVGCSSCHTLKAADSTGTVGPNLDQAKPSKAKIVMQVTAGGGFMPSFGGRLSKQQIEDVAAFVYASTHASG
jgi:cytochrome c553